MRDTNLKGSDLKDVDAEVICKGIEIDAIGMNFSDLLLTVVIEYLIISIGGTLMDIKRIRYYTGMTQKEFAERYHIPLQTLKQWESDPESSSYRKPPDYILYMLGRLTEIDHHV